MIIKTTLVLALFSSLFLDGKGDQVFVFFYRYVLYYDISWELLLGNVGDILILRA